MEMCIISDDLVRFNFYNFLLLKKKKLYDNNTESSLCTTKLWNIKYNLCSIFSSRLCSIQECS